MVWTNENDHFLPKLTLPPGFSGGGWVPGRRGTLIGDLGNPSVCTPLPQAKQTEYEILAMFLFFSF